MQAAKPHLHPKGLLSLQPWQIFKGVLGVVRGSLLEVTLMSRQAGEYLLQRYLPCLAIF